MAQPLVECIANYSEARRPEVVAEIASAIQSVPSVRMLDRHSDLDHNRTVLTFLGPPEAVEEAAFRSIAKAAQFINLDQHTGEHPRIGATDVVPFVPISGVSMQDCIEIARRLGSRVGSELGIPVYLYEEAATRPDRQNLENLRRGQYEGLKTEIETDPDRAPDFGPAKLSPAGATVIGARQPLIAYNVYLNTGDVSIAKKIAKAIRFSSGGMRYLKSLGLLVEGLAQVSMNLTNYRETPIARVEELIRREAQRYGVAIHHSELVGLIPEDALIDAAVWYLQLDQFEPEQILEKRLYSVAQEETIAETKAPAQDFLDQLAEGTPAPGGGAAAAYTGAGAAALVAMVARLTIGKKKYAAVDERMKQILTRAEELRADLTGAVDRDSAAFLAVMDAFRLPKDTPEQQQERQRAIDAATWEAAREPMQVARRAVELLRLAQETAGQGNQNAICDSGTGAALARAALTGAALNVRTNLNQLASKDGAGGMLSELQRLEAQAAEIEKEIRGILSERGGLSLP